VAQVAITIETSVSGRTEVTARPAPSVDAGAFFGAGQLRWAVASSEILVLPVPPPPAHMMSRHAWIAMMAASSGLPPVTAEAFARRRASFLVLAADLAHCTSRSCASRSVLPSCVTDPSPGMASACEGMATQHLKCNHDRQDGDRTAQR